LDAGSAGARRARVQGGTRVNPSLSAMQSKTGPLRARLRIYPGEVAFESPVERVGITVHRQVRGRAYVPGKKMAARRGWEAAKITRSTCHGS